MPDLKNDSGIKKFIEKAPVPICFIDSNGIILYANKAELEMLEYDLDEYTGHLVTDFHPDEEDKKAFLAKIEKHQPFENEDGCLVSKSGRTHHVLISSQEHVDEQGVTYSMLISRDVTKLKKIQKLSSFLNKASEDLIQTHITEEALNKILELIVPEFADWFTIDLLSEQGTLELAKTAHADPEKVMWAKKYRELNPVDLTDETYGSAAWVIRTGEVAFFPNITLEMIEAAAKSKEELVVLKNLNLRSAITVPLKSYGKIIGVVSFLSTAENKVYDEVDLNFAKDFTNRIALTLENSRLFEDIRTDISNKIAANRQKDDFLAIASHELKTPLTSVKGYIHILSSMIRKGEEIAALNILKKTERQINKMTKLIHNFLDISRLESSKLVIEKEVFDLNELVSETINYFNLPENKERLRFNAGQINSIHADRSKISQVIDNYLSNALKYSPADALVVLSTFMKGNDIVVSVEDKGIGINESSKKQIFERFYRADNMKNATASGFGIGLYLSNEIIKLHGGKAWFESQEQKGSTFYFSLPCN